MFIRLCIVVPVCFLSLSLYAQLPVAPPSVEPDTVVEHTPGRGVNIVTKPQIAVDFSIYTTFRYLNQKGLNSEYTDAFDRPHSIKRRDDLQMQKVTLYFLGWLIDPRFRFALYTWTTNVSQGQGAQVVVAGNLQYKLKSYFSPGMGIGALPTSRSLYGQWPAWLRQDARPMAEEFFRGSFTTGIWAQGEIAKGLYYKTMIGNNLSQLGIDAGQLDNGFDTWSTALWWTTNDFGRFGPFGDFENHRKPATIFGASYTRSNETRQSQPATDDPENTQIRLSDGTGVFSVNAFNNNSQVLAALYQMASAHGGIKYRGLSLDGEYFLRWINKFETAGTIPVSTLFDHGYTVQASGMIINKVLQLYGVWSYINGEYGIPWEVNAGLNWYILRNRILRLNPELIIAHHSPVGYLSYPTVVGARGAMFMVNLELYY